MVKVENADAMVCQGERAGRQGPACVSTLVRKVAWPIVTTRWARNIDIWEPKQSAGLSADSTHHGVPSWFETLTTDTDRATKYYTELFGWTAEVQDMGGMKYTSFKLGDEFVGGMMKITPEMGPIPAHWGVYFTVNDVEKAASDTTKLGGTLFVPVTDIPGVGRFCGILSPQGVRFYALQYSR
jgi:predicted enzyme related to lactoylglutathione lyase